MDTEIAFQASSPIKLSWPVSFLTGLFLSSDPANALLVRRRGHDGQRCKPLAGMHAISASRLVFFASAQKKGLTEMENVFPAFCPDQTSTAGRLS